MGNLTVTTTQTGTYTGSDARVIVSALNDVWSGRGANFLHETGDDVISHSTLQQGGPYATAIDRRMEAHGFRADIDVMLFKMRHDIRHGTRDFF